jgi:hypothetical protein
MYARTAARARTNKPSREPSSRFRRSITPMEAVRSIFLRRYIYDITSLRLMPFFFGHALHQINTVPRETMSPTHHRLTNPFYHGPYRTNCACVDRRFAFPFQITEAKEVMQGTANKGSLFRYFLRVHVFMFLLCTCITSHVCEFFLWWYIWASHHVHERECRSRTCVCGIAGDFSRLCTCVCVCVFSRVFVNCMCMCMHVCLLRVCMHLYACSIHFMYACICVYLMYACTHLAACACTFMRVYVCHACIFPCP